MTNIEIKTAYMPQWKLMMIRFRQHKLAFFAFWVLVVIYTTAMFCEFFAPYTLNHRDFNNIYSPPQRVGWLMNVEQFTGKQDSVTWRAKYEPKETPGKLEWFVRGENYKLIGFIPGNIHLFGTKSGTVYLFGTDALGRDIFSRILYGARISLTIGLLGVFISFLLGLTIGALSGYIGGWVDNLIQRLIELLRSFPAIPLWLALSAALPSSWSPVQVYLGITAVLSFIGWTALARQVRGKIMSLKNEDYVVAAIIAGSGRGRILIKHLLPACMSHIIVSLTLAVPAMILGETALSFLGLGLRPPVTSWGVLLRDAQNVQAIAVYPWLLTPAIFIIITVLFLNFLGDGLRDAADPYSKR
jgi:peptide/nickel transport system permease protein